MGIKQNHTNEFKAKVVMAAMREDRTLSELATKSTLATLALSAGASICPPRATRAYSSGPGVAADGSLSYPIERK